MQRSAGLARRFGLLFLLLAIEWIPLSAVIHTKRGGASTARFLVAFGALFLIFGYARMRQSETRPELERASGPVGWRFFAAHVFALLVFLFISLYIKPEGHTAVAGAVVTAAWFAAGLGVIGLATLAFVPPVLAGQLLRGTGNAWVYALAGGAMAWRLASAAWSLWYAASWQPLTNLTFRTVEMLLHGFLPVVVADPRTLTIGAGNFIVEIGPQCSGYEGLGLMLAFSVAWLYFFRKEIQFPRGLLLVPAGLAVMWILNVVRIAALILIDIHGAPGIAMGGFHSQAGWISFSGVTLGLAAVLRNMPWFGKQRAGKTTRGAPAPNPTATYLTPLMAILAASLIAHAASDGFEWLYPLRLAAAGAALWALRRRLTGMDWRFGWFGPALGVVVFALWIALDDAGKNAGMPGALAAASAGTRMAWIAVRVLAAVVTVPMAEELAFRGFLIRRLVAADFETVPLTGFGWWPLFGSSLAFGLLHGERWVAGTLAGVLYGLAMRRQGRIGEAVAAHATTNALLAGYVLVLQRWQLW